jgi:hypothetical protein
MKARELKKLNKEFKEFIDERTFVNLRTAIAEFWFAKFGCNNQKREDELYIYFYLGRCAIYHNKSTGQWQNKMETNKYIVVRMVDDRNVIGITERENFKTVSLGDCYDDYGIKAGDLYKELYDVEVEAWTYYDGSKYVSYILPSGVGLYDVEEVDEELENSILSELPNKPSLTSIRKELQKLRPKTMYLSLASFPVILSIAG